MEQNVQSDVVDSESVKSRQSGKEANVDNADEKFSEDSKENLSGKSKAQLRAERRAVQVDYLFSNLFNLCTQ